VWLFEVCLPGDPNRAAAPRRLTCRWGDYTELQPPRTVEDSASDCPNDAVAFARNPVNVAAQYCTQRPLPEKLRNSRPGHSVTGGNLLTWPSMDKIEQDDSPLNVRAMQMGKYRHLRRE
jgi:hypothetical protein